MSPEILFCRESADNEQFNSSLNSTFIIEESNTADIIHDILFQKFGKRLLQLRSRRLEVLRKKYHPELCNDFPTSQDLLDGDKDTVFNDSIILHHQRINKQKKEYEEDPIFNDSIQLHYQNLSKLQKEYVESPKLIKSIHYNNLSTLISNDSDDLVETSDLSSQDSTSSGFIDSLEGTYSLPDSSLKKKICFSDRFSKETNHTNSWTEGNRNFILASIEFQECSIQIFKNILNSSKSEIGFAGSKRHLEADKGLLIAELQRDALLAKLNKDLGRAKITQKENLSCQITINNICCDTDIIGESDETPSCYYLLIVQHDITVSSTEISAPDIYGFVEFKTKIEFENVNNSFLIKLKLYKLLLQNEPQIPAWLYSFKADHLQLSKFRLVGEHHIKLTNMRHTCFNFSSEILYANVLSTIQTDFKKSGSVTILKIKRKNMTSYYKETYKRWCLIEGTNLKFYDTAQDCQPTEIMSLVHCISCKPSCSARMALEIEFAYNCFGRTLYLQYEDKETLADWLKHIKIGIESVKAFGL